jgi:hypothetical protein
MGSVAEWGPAAWKFLHAVTFSYPETPSLNEQVAVEQLFASLRYVLPCAQCRTHFEAELRAHPPDTRSRATLSAWLVDLHNRVNRRLGKRTVTYSEAQAAFSAQCGRACAEEDAEPAAAARHGRQARSGGGSGSASTTTATRALALIVAIGVAALIWVSVTSRRRAAGASV